MWGIDLPLLLVTLPLIGGVAAFPAKPRDSRGPAALFLLIAIIIGAGVAVFAFVALAADGDIVSVVGGWEAGVGIHLLLDGAAVVLITCVYLISGAIVLFAQGEGGYGSIFYGILGIAIAGMVGVILSADLFNLFVFLEVLSLAATMLIAYKRRLPALYAAFRYLLLCSLSAALYLVGLFILYRETGELSFYAVALGAEGGSAAVSTAGILLFAGVALRAAMVPFHAWLPDAHGQAPHPVSALLSGLVLKASILALWRIVTLLPRVSPLLLAAGAVSAVGGVAAALVQRDTKRLLAFHSISQMGLVAAAAGAGGAAAALYHAVGHALFKSLLFLALGYIILLRDERDIYALAKRSGEGGAAGATLFLLIGSAAIAGIPPFVGFASKTALAGAFKETQLYTLLRIVSTGTVASFIKLSLVVGGPRRLLPRRAAPGARVSDNRDRGGESSHLPPGPAGRRLCYAAMGVLALGVAALGIFPAGILSLASQVGVRVALDDGVIYTGSGILESFLILLSGSLLYLLIRRPILAKPIAWLEKRRTGVDGALALVSGGVLAALFLVR